MKEIFHRQIKPPFLPSSSSFTTKCLCWYLQDSSGGWIRNDYNSYRTHNRTENGCFV